jgi:hypothetical protein
MGRELDGIEYEINEYGNYVYDTYAGGVTHWEYDPETGMSRHCGDEPGSFWTDWE